MIERNQLNALRYFALGSFFTFMMGIRMYGTTYLVPLFLAQARGFSALRIGQTVLVVGLVQFVISPFNIPWICA